MQKDNSSFHLNTKGRIMRNPAFGICEKNDHGADQCVCFRYNFSFLIGNVKAQVILSGYTARIVTDLVGNPKTGFLMTTQLLSFAAPLENLSTRSDTSRAVQPQMMLRGSKFGI